jgi:hypothetical protein
MNYELHAARLPARSQEAMQSLYCWRGAHSPLVKIRFVLGHVTCERCSEQSRISEFIRVTTDLSYAVKKLNETK